MFVSFLFTVGLVLQVLAAPADQTGPIVETGYTKFIGVPSSETGVQFFGGIRYAQPPVGDLRWRAPQPLNESPPRPGVAKSVTNASEYGNICVQQPGTLDWNGQSDDCLFLNVFKPVSAKRGSKLPVIVYIHGGGNYGASARGFPLDKWVRVAKGSVIGVSIQYRLGLLGFLSSHMVIEDGLANAGLHDQRAALEWLHRNIAAFGGDPDHITISGESAGGGDVVYHLTAYGGKGKPLFQGAIAQSIGTDPVFTPTVYEGCFSHVLNSTGCNTTLTDSHATMTCLRSVPLAAIVTAVNTKPSTCKFTPIIDGPDGLIPAHASTLLREGRFHKLPVIAGSTTDDGATFAGNPTGITNTTAGFIANIRKRYVTLTDASAQRMADLYPEEMFNSTWARAATAWGDAIFTCQDWFIVDKLRSRGENRAFTYRWATPDPVRLRANPWSGAMHTSDLFFLFNGTDSGPDAGKLVVMFNPLNETETALGEEAMAYWTSFAHSFNPSKRKLPRSPAWPPLGSTAQRMVINEGASVDVSGSFVETITETHKERCRFWNEIGPEIGL